MKMLTMKAREVVDEIAEQAGMAPGDALNALLESIVPGVPREQILAKLIETTPAWMTLEPGQSVAVELGLGEEAAFRAKLLRYKKQSWQVLSTRKTGRGTILVTREM